MNTCTPVVLSFGIVLLGLLIPIVPRPVVPLLRPYPYDDPYVGAGITRIGPAAGLERAAVRAAGAGRVQRADATSTIQAPTGHTAERSMGALLARLIWRRGPSSPMGMLGT